MAIDVGQQGPYRYCPREFLKGGAMSVRCLGVGSLLLVLGCGSPSPAPGTNDGLLLSALTCSEGQVLRWHEGDWACGDAGCDTATCESACSPTACENACSPTTCESACSPTACENACSTTACENACDSEACAGGTADPSQLNVKDFGAVGDGETDDTAAIQAAIDGLPTHGGTLVIPPGVYLVSKTLHLHQSGIVFAGRSMGHSKQVLKPTDALYGSVLKATTDFEGDALIQVGVLDAFTRQRIIIERLFLYCQDQDITGLLLTNTNNPFMARDLAIYNCGAYGIYSPYTELEGAEQVVAGRFENLYVRNNGVGMRLMRSNSTVVQNSVFLNSVNAGFEMVSGNNNSFINSMFEMNGKEGLLLKGQPNGLPLQSVLVENCRFERNNKPADDPNNELPGTGESLSIGFRVRGATVLSSRFQTDQVGILVEGRNVSVIGAEFEDSLSVASIKTTSTAHDTLVLNPQGTGHDGEPEIIDEGTRTTLIGYAGKNYIAGPLSIEGPLIFPDGSQLNSAPAP